MQIDGTIITADLSDVISTLREQLAEQQVYLFAKTKDVGEDLMVQCPYHKDGQENTPSMGIRKSDGLCHCLACGETHALPEMIGFCFNTNAINGHKWLINNFNSEIVQVRESINFNITRGVVERKQERQYVSEEELDSYRYVHPYMYERGLTDAVIEKFDIGYDKKTDSITFPVRDASGKTLFVVRRTIKYKSFYIPKGIDKPLYGFYEAVNQSKLVGGNLDKLYLTEGQFDALRLWCNNRYAVAGFGCLYNSLQLSELEKLPTRHLVLALDNDVAGQVASEKLKKQIKSKIITSVVLPNGRKDIGECTDEEIKNLEERML